MKKLNYYLLALVCLLFVTVSCTSDSDTLQTEESVVSHLPKDVEKVILENGLDTKDFEYRVLAFGNIEVVITAGDIAFTKENFINAYSSNVNIESRQYASQFQVNTNKFSTINIYGFTGAQPAGFGLSPNAITALNKAITNWNSVFGASIRFNLTTGNNTSPDPNVFETFIYVDSKLNGFSGAALFPGQDNSPGKALIISNSANASNNAVGLEHLITHELGHTIGFRHTDWDTRRSCVINGLQDKETKEPTANLIFLSPPSNIYQSNSIMNACFSSNTTTGKLNGFDKIALMSLYPR